MHGLPQTPVEPYPPSKPHQWTQNQRDSTPLIRSPLAAACEAKMEISGAAGALKYFRVDETRDDLSTLRLIDWEEGYTIMKDMFVVVKVADHEVSFQRAAWIRLHIVILDEGDNPPFFVGPKMQFSIQENLPAPAVFGEVRVTDPDIQPIDAIDYDRIPTIYEAESAHDGSMEIWNSRGRRNSGQPLK
ncbi:unnamed protein product [Calicophoron daubneyi]|uniref:Cadherin domain-containing protein n=1 Tax=Calicophoron daubneyi TaxID=300641 RepID=A0AAV2SYC4_CALDB